MISLFEGRIGGGKTYLAVCNILAHLGKGGTVITNVDLNIEGCRAYIAKHYGLQMEETAIRILGEDETSNFHRHLVAGSRDLPVLAVIDEAHLWFNAKDSALTSATKRGLLTFLSQSRKLGVDVVFIVQAAENLESQFRRLAAETWRMRDLRKIVVPFLGLRWPWEDILAFRIDTATGLCMQRKLIRRTQDIFDAYNTAALLRPVEFAGEVVGIRNLQAADRPAKKILPTFDDVPPKMRIALGMLSAVLLKIAIYG